MTADVELLPLPPLGECSEDSVQEWGRANVEAHTEALRAEGEALKEIAAYNHDTAMRVGALLEAAEARAERLAEALRLIAAPKRPDGTWNRDREACRQIAAEAIAAAQEDDDA